LAAGTLTKPDWISREDANRLNVTGNPLL